MSNGERELSAQVSKLQSRGWKKSEIEIDWEKSFNLINNYPEEFIAPFLSLLEGYSSSFTNSSINNQGLLGLINPFNFPIIWLYYKGLNENNLNTLVNKFCKDRVKERSASFKLNTEEPLKIYNNKKVIYTLASTDSINKRDKEKEEYESLRNESEKKESHYVPCKLIRRVIDYLGEPLDITVKVWPANESSPYFSLSSDRFSSIYFQLFETNTFDIETYQDCRISISWENFVLEVLTPEINHNSFHYFFSVHKDGRQDLENALKGCCLQVLKNNTKFGLIKHNFELNDFHKETIKLRNLLINELNYKDKPSFNVLISGEPGTGKSEWIKTFAATELYKRGYFILHLNYYSIGLLDSIHKAFPKVAVMINEVDNLVPNRESLLKVGESEQILESFDKNNDMVEPIYDNQEAADSDGQSLIVLMTCNTVERLDSAFLREGRIDFKDEFEYNYLKEKKNYDS